MIEFNKETTTIQGKKAYDMFFDTIEIVGSVQLNKDHAKRILNQVPNDILEYFRNGLTVFTEITDEIFRERKGLTPREIDLKTRDGVREYMSRAVDVHDWNRRCDNVKATNNGYPSFWYETIIASGLMAETKLGWPR